MQVELRKAYVGGLFAKAIWREGRHDANKKDASMCIR